MKTAFKFKEYIWLVETIHKARRITFAEIQEKWLRSSLSEGVELGSFHFQPTHGCHSGHVRHLY